MSAIGHLFFAFLVNFSQHGQLWIYGMPTCLLITQLPMSIGYFVDIYHTEN
jgi:hypothetical protein